MSDFEDDNNVDMEKSNNFLASMSALEGGRRRFLHGTDDSQVLDKPLSEITGSKLTVQSLLFDDAGNTGDGSKKKKKKKTKNQKQKEGEKVEGDVEKIYKKTVVKSKEKLSLAAPLATPQAQKAGRLAVYKKVSKDVAAWDAVIHSRRAATVVSFPLEKPDLKLKSVTEHNLTAFTPRTALEAEVMAALHGGATPAKDDNQKSKAGLTFKEQWHQMQELARLKAHQRYQETKIARQNKIKSKSYRRHLRRQKAKEKEKELEELAKSNPELAAEKLSEMEGDRTLERFTLKHTKANKNRKLLFKLQADKKSGDKATNATTKHILDTMTKKKAELLKKATPVDEDDEEDEDLSDDEASAMLNGDEKVPVYNADVLLSEEKNPWISGDQAKTFGDHKEGEVKERMAKLLMEMEKKAEVNPNNFAVVKEKNLIKVSNTGEESDDDDDDEDMDDDIDSEDEAKRRQIGEIFAEDNLVAEEFEAEKREKGRQKKAKVETALPGWGSWSGQSKNNRKRRRPIEKVKAGLTLPKVVKAVPKKDFCTARENVILSDDKSALRDKQSASVPFPYTSVADYEASLRLPLSDTFIPRTSHKKLIQPKMKIPLGTVIEPMDKQVLVRRGILPSKTLDMND